MTLILSGTDGLSDVDGSAATPAIRGTDANTGIFFPAADTIAFSEGGAEAMRIDSSGNVGIGTSSPGSILELNRAGSGAVGPNLYLENSASSATGNASRVSFGIDAGSSAASPTAYIENVKDAAGPGSSYLAFGTFGASLGERARIDSSGNVGIGSTPSGTYKLEVNGSIYGTGFSAVGNATFNRGSGTAYNVAGGIQLQIDGTTYAAVRQPAAEVLAFYRGSGGTTETARIDSSGNLLVGTTSALGGKFSVSTASTSWAGWFQQTQGAGNSCLSVEYSAAAPNNATDYFGLFRDNVGQKIQLRSNGGIGNYSANNVNLSDERTKTDIQNAGGYLTKICAIPVRTFKYKDQTDDLLNLGVIAQEVEAVAPELVDVSGFGETPEDGVPLKAIYQTDLQYALMKSIQELKALVDTQASTITTLTDRITALETPTGTQA